LQTVTIAFISNLTIS